MHRNMRRSPPKAMSPISAADTSSIHREAMKPSPGRNTETEYAAPSSAAARYRRRLRQSLHMRAVMRHRR